MNGQFQLPGNVSKMEKRSKGMCCRNKAKSMRKGRKSGSSRLVGAADSRLKLTKWPWLLQKKLNQLS